MTAVSGAGAPQLPSGYTNSLEFSGQLSSESADPYARGKSPSVKDDSSIGASTSGPGALKRLPSIAKEGVRDEGFKSEHKSNPVDGASRGSETLGTTPTSVQPRAANWGDLYSSVHRATPSSFTREMDEYLADVAEYAMREPDETYDIIRSSYAATPGSFYKEDEMIVMASALR